MGVRRRRPVLVQEQDHRVQVSDERRSDVLRSGPEVGRDLLLGCAEVAGGRAPRVEVHSALHARGVEDAEDLEGTDEGGPERGAQAPADRLGGSVPADLGLLLGGLCWSV